MNFSPYFEEMGKNNNVYGAIRFLWTLEAHLKSLPPFPINFRNIDANIQRTHYLIFATPKLSSRRRTSTFPDSELTNISELGILKVYEKCKILSKYGRLAEEFSAYCVEKLYMNFQDKMNIFFYIFVRQCIYNGKSYSYSRIDNEGLV